MFFWMRFLVVFIGVVLLTDTVFSGVHIPGLPQSCMRNNGKLNLGGIFPLHSQRGSYRESNTCGKLNPIATQVVFSFLYAIERVNADQSILHNITLGYTIFDSCGKDTVGLSRALQFASYHQLKRRHTDNWQEANQTQAVNFKHLETIDCYTRAATNHPCSTRQQNEPKEPTEDDCGVNNQYAAAVEKCRQGQRNEYTVEEQALRIHSVTEGHDTFLCDAGDVVGVIGDIFSESSMLIAYVLGVLRIPQVSPASGSDLLNDKLRFPYFLRTISADSEQAKAIMDIIDWYGWRYISVLYTDGTFGERPAQLLHKIAKKRSVCFNFIRWLPSTTMESEWDQISYELTAQHAHVLISFLDPEQLSSIKKSLRRLGKTDDFIWLCIFESALSDFKGMEAFSEGIIFLRPWSPVDQHGYLDWLASMTLDEYGKFYWFREYWEEVKNCSFSKDTCDRNGSAAIGPHPVTFGISSIVYNIMTAVETFARALDKLIAVHCSQTSDLETDEPCIKRSQLLTYLKQVSFEPYPGHVVAFDTAGNIVPFYRIYTIWTDGNSFRQVSVGFWTENRMEINDSLIPWARDPENVPKSACNQPCPLRHYQLHLNPHCCWECKPCHSNEYLLTNLSACEPCPLLFWPDPDNGTQCFPLEANYLHFYDLTGTALACFAGVGVILTIFVIVVYTKIRHIDLIKATSRELSIIILLGVLLSYVVVFVLISKPTNTTCFILHITFPLPFTLIYGPLLLKTNRIYRIFSKGKKTKVTPRCVSPKSQLIVSTVIVLLQVRQLFHVSD